MNNRSDSCKVQSPKNDDLGPKNAVLSPKKASKIEKGA